MEDVCFILNAVAESVERRPPVREIGSSIPGRVKPMTYQIKTCRFIAWRLTLIEYGKDWLVRSQDNVTERDIESQ